MSTEAARPARHPLGGRGAALAALCLGALILNVDTTIALVLAAGSLSDRLGRKVIISAGLALFGLAMFWTSRESQATSYAILVAQAIGSDSVFRDYPD